MATDAGRRVTRQLLRRHPDRHGRWLRCSGRPRRRRRASGRWGRVRATAAGVRTVLWSGGARPAPCRAALTTRTLGRGNETAAGAAGSHGLVDYDTELRDGGGHASSPHQPGGERGTDVVSKRLERRENGFRRREPLARDHPRRPLRALRAGAPRRRTPTRGRLRPACLQSARYTAAWLPRAPAPCARIESPASHLRALGRSGKSTQQVCSVHRS